MGLLDGKRGLIYGVRNEYSIAWGCVKSLVREGATLTFSVFSEREAKDAQKLAEKLPAGSVQSIEICNLTVPEEVAALHEKLAANVGALDFVIHAVAYARGLEGRFVDVSYADFEISLQSSAYTLVAAAKAAEPLLVEGGSIVTLTYLGGERVIPNYNTAGIAKATLESCVRYIANDLGPGKGIRVNAISAGPVMTLSARGITGFRDMFKFSGESSPLRHSTTIDEVGDTCAFLCSSLSRGMTGGVLFVDSGYNILGMPTGGAG